MNIDLNLPPNIDRLTDKEKIRAKEDVYRRQRILLVDKTIKVEWIKDD